MEGITYYPMFIILPALLLNKIKSAQVFRAYNDFIIFVNYYWLNIVNPIARINHNLMPVVDGQWCVMGVSISLLTGALENQLGPEQQDQLWCNRLCVESLESVWTQHKVFEHHIHLLLFHTILLGFFEPRIIRLHCTYVTMFWLGLIRP